MRLICYRHSLPIRGLFTISRGSRSEAVSVMVEIEHNGIIGRGECVPYARYNESVQSVMYEIDTATERVEAGISREQLQAILPSGAARNAIDCALWDLECKRANTSIWALSKLAPQPLLTAYTLSLDTPENMHRVAKENAHRPLLKLKLGGVEDLDRVRAVRRGAPDARIILDANEAWDVGIYKALIPELVKLNVAMIEQPFPADSDQVLAQLPHPIPICADESCHDRESLAKIIGRYEMINIKLDKAGGLTEALALKSQAEAKGLRVMVGCMLAGSLSMAPAFVVAQGAEIVDLDGPLLLKEDVENGFEFVDNMMIPFTDKLWG